RCISQYISLHDALPIYPDWCIHVPNRRRSESRNQLVLDFSREDVCKEITKRITTILESAPISYVKWDMNRNMTEMGSSLLPKHRDRKSTRLNSSHVSIS